MVKSNKTMSLDQDVIDWLAKRPNGASDYINKIVRDELKKEKSKPVDVNETMNEVISEESKMSELERFLKIPYDITMPAYYEASKRTREGTIPCKVGVGYRMQVMEIAKEMGLI